MSTVPVETMRHSAAHLMAAAVAELYPGAKFGIGPVVEHGFYYDVLFPEPIGPDALPTIEKRMEEIRTRDDAFVREEMPLDDAIAFFADRGQDFKVSLLTDLKTRGTTRIKGEEAQDVDPSKPSVASVYRTGDFVDLCRGPHVAHAKEIGAFRLTKLAGAYWRGDDANPQLTRIYGLCFATKDELAAHLRMLEEAEKRDHRKLGAELDLFAFSPLVGSGLPLFTARGTIMRGLLTDFIWELMKPYGYQRVMIPHIAKTDLYRTSGHWDKFEDDLFHVSSKKTDEAFVLKPMNCPHHTQLYAAKPRSYRDLPIRMSEVTTVYRDENTGQLQGLSRVRSITQDDAHVFCTPAQVKDEVLAMYAIASAFYRAFGMSFHRVRLSVRDPERPEKYLGADALWQDAERTLAEAMESVGRAVEVGQGEAAFYGPKIDFMVKDAIGREWQLATIQLDFNQPERFGLAYADSDGTEKRPVMVHRAILGSVERFLGIVIEHYAGAFPTWLAPVQVAVISVAERHAPQAKELAARLAAAGIRVEVDDANESVGKKIRTAEKMKVPYMLVLGDKELAASTLAVRRRGNAETEEMSVEAFVDRVRTESAERTA